MPVYFVYYLNPSSACVAVIVDGQGRLLVERRGREPGKGTLDLPGGFADFCETVEEGLCREVLEETGLKVVSLEYLFSLPNEYFFSGFTIPTLDMFFRCEVADASALQAGDDAADCFWLPLSEVKPEPTFLKAWKTVFQLPRTAARVTRWYWPSRANAIHIHASTVC